MSRSILAGLFISIVLQTAVVFSIACGGDWPMWRYDAYRSAASPEPLPDDLQLIWSRTLGPRQPAWDDTLNRDLMTYDRLLEPIVKDGRLFLGFNDADKLVAYDLLSGQELWTFYCSGPVRLPPVAWEDRVFFVSDDGHLYCLAAATGELQWSFRGGPNARQILGNQRLISAWPMRGGPVIRDGTVYVTASIWPFMGTFIYAIDARSGRTLWVNDETGAQYIKQPHSAPSFAGVAPQGALVATDKVLLVPGGRSVPAAFDRHTGKLLYFELNAGGKGTGGSFLAANESSWFVHTRGRETREFSLATGVKTAFLPQEPVLAGDRIYSAQTVDKKPVLRCVESDKKKVIWETPIDGRGDLILAGNTLFAAGLPSDGGPTSGGPTSGGPTSGGPTTPITAVRLPSESSAASAAWSVTAPGTVERLVAADGKLIAVTREGQLLVYGRPDTKAATSVAVHDDKARSLVEIPTEPAALRQAEQILAAGEAEGYAIWLGAADVSLVEALAARSPFAELTVIDDHRPRVDRLRRTLDAAGKYGRVSVHETPLPELLLPPYIANMLIVGAQHTAALRDQGLASRLYETVRPYGGVMYLLAAREAIPALQSQLSSQQLPGAVVTATELGVVVRRAGPLPGAGTWTHQYGDIANTIKSNDQLVKLPLGVLWFGGVSHEDILPRHGHGPPEQVIGGRLFIQGVNSLTARDVYTGRVLWKREFQDLGTYDVYFDATYKETPLDTAYNQVHIPGANARGTNYVATSDRIYILEGAVCHVLDTATGKSLADFTLPPTKDGPSPEWGYIGVYENVLIGGFGFARYASREKLDAGVDNLLSKSRAGFGTKSLDRAASLALVGFDRISGKQLWRVEARHSFWHNGIVAGRGRVYALDKNPLPVEEYLRRRGQAPPETYRLLAFDARDGKTIWELPGKVFGTWLGYSQDHDLLLQAGAAASDRLWSEVGQGMAVYRGETGETVWQKDNLKYSGPCVLHNDLIISNANSYTESAGAFRLEDGSQKMIENPLTGELQPWKITRAYGCNSIIACENLLTFRSGAAGFYDLSSESGTGNLGGFRSGCTANLVAADGVLNAPDYTRTCSCSYQNQTSLALVHMPEMDVWTISNAVTQDEQSGRIRQVGVNFGAPGDRRDSRGLMWLEYPFLSGDTKSLQVTIRGNPTYYQDHPTSLAEAELPWVASSGVEGLQSVRIDVGSGGKPDQALPAYQVRLHFGLPRDGRDELREFDVSVSGQTKTIRLGGDAGTSLVHSLEHVQLTEALDITFTARTGRPILSGIELQAE